VEPQPHTPSPTHAHGGPDLKAYLAVFYLLCALTAVSFVVNFFLGQNQTSMLIILAVAVVKALCVAMIFMHLKMDWGKLYFIIVPVVIMGIMMMIVLLPDIVLAWHRD
jgi:caa(3)-type oxidase subunit IV